MLFRSHMIAEVVKSVIQGALLAVIVLFIFLRLIKSTVIIGLAIPVSVFITLFLMYFTKISINMISMAGLLLGIGMLVDNSIVVLENIYAYRQKDTKPRVGEIRTRGQKNVVQARSFAELLENAIKKYQNRAIETAQVIEELIKLAKDMREAARRGESLGLSEDEVVFYDALEVNDSAVAVLGDETLQLLY